MVRDYVYADTDADRAISKAGLELSPKTAVWILINDFQDFFK